MSDNAFSPDERAAVYRAIAERRDMRHFSGGTVAPQLLSRLLEAAHQAPSVGLMQPWRFIRISDRQLRGKVQALVEEERVRTAQALGERSDEFMTLKVEGINACAEVLVAALMDDREKHIFGRRTLPEMDMASLSCAIQNLWLAARVEGLGMGWVSLFDPLALADLLGLPAGAKPLENVVCADGGASIAKMPGGTEWKKRYDAKYPGQFQVYSPYFYDATMLLADAMKRANSWDPKVYIPFLQKSDYSGVTSKIQFEKNGEMKNPSYTLSRYVNGNKTPIDLN